MNGKKLYILALISMLLLAAFGAWVMVDGVAAYRKTPRVEEQSRQQEFQSQSHPLAKAMTA